MYYSLTPVTFTVVSSVLISIKSFNLPATSALTILNANVGTVDYATGNVTISNVSVNAIATGTIIKIYGRSEESDIVGKLNDLIEIKTDDTTVTAKGTRE